MTDVEIRDLKDKVLDSLNSEFESMVDKMVIELSAIEGSELRNTVVESIAHHVSLHLSYHVSTRIDFEK